MSILFFTSFLLYTILSNFSYAGITPLTPLSIGQTLNSSNGVFQLGFFTPNSSNNHYVGIWFKNFVPRVVVWVANREKPVKDSTAILTVTTNGTLLVLDGKRRLVWSIGDISASNGSRAELSDTGNLIVIDSVSGTTLWQSFDHLTDTLLPFSSLSYNLSTGQNRMLTSWKSDTDPSPGKFSFQITPQVPSQLFTMKGPEPYWRSGPWAKTSFTGIPVMDETYTSPFTLQQDANRSGSFTYLETNISRIMITPEGLMRIQRYDGTGWDFYSTLPVTLCEYYNACGPSGLCVMSAPPKCICFKGFVPKFPEEWKRRNWTHGCVRRTQLQCQGNSTGGKDVNIFHPLANIKTPDSYKLTTSFDARRCFQSCLQNCSCLAYSFIQGIGCLVWNEDLMDAVQFSSRGELLLFIRLASSELGRNGRNKTITAIIVSLSLFVILCSAAFGFWRYKVKHKVSTNILKEASQNAFSTNILKEASQNAWRNDMKPQDVSGLNFFDMNTIETATNDFSLSNILGQGGFGSVYKGKLQDGKEIAVKRLSSSSTQGKEEFMNEIVLISKLQHKNLVRILGCCIEGEERLLIYEFMVNRSLDTYLFDSRKRLEIDWPKRFSIIQGIARGLHYLHRDSRLRIIHRDLKVCNILLDEKMIPKISDFGLARMYEGTAYQDNTRRVVGTLGYMAPEYAWTGIFSEKSDIYSFGICNGKTKDR